MECKSDGLNREVLRIGLGTFGSALHVGEGDQAAFETISKLWPGNLLNTAPAYGFARRRTRRSIVASTARDKR